MSPGRKGTWADGSQSWKVVVDSWGRTMPLGEQIALINRLAFLDFKVYMLALPLSGKVHCQVTSL